MTITLISKDLDALYESALLRQVEDERVGGCKSYRLQSSQGEVTVRRTILRDGLELTDYTGRLDRPLSMRFETMYPHLELSHTFAGQGGWSCSGGLEQEVAPGTTTMLHLTECKVHSELSPADAMAHLELRIDLRRFASLTAELRRVTNGSLYMRQTNRPQLRNLFAQLRDCPYDGELRRLYLEGKCYELLACAIAQAKGDAHSPSAIRLNSEDLRCLHDARNILSRRLHNPPSLLELARMVGINDYKLKRGFKEIFDTTVFGYIRNLRMNEARRLLESGEFNVSAVAAQVGYTNMSHFASAYRRAFGYNPSECLRRQPD